MSSAALDWHRQATRYLCAILAPRTRDYCASEEAAAEAIARTWARLGEPVGEAALSRFVRYARTAALRVLIDQHRARVGEGARERPALLSMGEMDPAGDAPEPDAHAELEDQRAMLREALDEIRAADPLAYDLAARKGGGAPLTTRERVYLSRARRRLGYLNPL